MTGKELISLYDTDSPFTIYSQDLFWSDKWDGKNYGRDYDFTRPFFDQFAELQKAVPRLSINGIANDNSLFTSYCSWCKNCYLMYTSDRNEDCYYGSYVFDSKNCTDLLFVMDSTLCHELLDSKKCYHCLYGSNLENCMDCFFCRDLIGCKNCFGCIGLRNNEYCFFNEQLGKDEYQKRLSALKLDSFNEVNKIKNEVDSFFLKYPRKSLDIQGSETVTGDHIKFSKKCFDAYDIQNCQDCKFVSHVINTKDCMDWDYYGDKAEMCYQMASCASNVNYCAFCTNSWNNNSNLYYCDLLSTSKNCFGCIGLKKGNYCILNKEYTKEEYEKMVAKIIEQMQKNGEWGEFFPAKLSPFAYNETVAVDYLPLTEDQALKFGYKWKTQDKKSAYQGAKVELPDSINDLDESICKKILTCEKSGENYKIIPQELDFYKTNKIPLPRRSPTRRYLDRMALRNPRTQWDRECAKCKAAIRTSYAPDRPEIVYCEKCYLKEVY